MRKLEELLKHYDAVCAMVEEDVKESFVQECLINGFKFHDGGSLTGKNCGPRMALHSFNRTVWYIAGMCWHAYFTNPRAIIEIDPGATTKIFINYKAYFTGKKKYVYKTLDELVEPEPILYS